MQEDAPHDPFANSSTLARWVANILSAKGIDQINKWRMVEYWMQVELYRAVEDGKAGTWRYLGEHEQPYWTNAPLPRSKSNIKWVDLLLAEPSDRAQRIIWVELKDIGRNQNTLDNNLTGVGLDLAALYKINIPETRKLWRGPHGVAVDRGRLEEWQYCAPALDCDAHLIAQIVVVSKKLLDVEKEDSHSITDKWLTTFEKRVEIQRTEHSIQVARSDTVGFAIFGLVANVPTSCAL